MTTEGEEMKAAALLVTNEASRHLNILNFRRRYLGMWRLLVEVRDLPGAQKRGTWGTHGHWLNLNVWDSGHAL